MTTTTQKPAFLARLDQLEALTTTREVTRQREGPAVMLGAIAAIVDDATWAQALGSVEQVTR